MTESAKLIRDFIKDTLRGDVDALKSFDFSKLSGGKRYGCRGRNFDCDDTDLARAIYHVVWQDLPELNMENLRAAQKYRGETLNTAKTLFGFEPKCEKLYWRAAKFSDDKDFFAEIKNFRAKFLTIGNFMPLPNYSLPDRRVTINTYRSWGKWYDFFGKFLFELHKCFIGATDRDEGLMRLMDANRHYFDYFNNDMKKFSKVNFLELYFNDQGEVDLLPFDCDYPKQCDCIKNPTQEQKEEYVAYAKEYILRATKVIDYRADKMIRVVKGTLGL